MTLEICTQICEESSECRSLTFLRQLDPSKWCTHFSTDCSSTRAVKGAVIVIFQPRVSVFSLATGYGKECDFGHGEVYVSRSSGLAGSLSACLDSCEATAVCRSVVFYYNSNWCSHASTACTKTKPGSNAVSFTKRGLDANKTLNRPTYLPTNESTDQPTNQPRGQPGPLS